MASRAKARILPPMLETTFLPDPLYADPEAYDVAFGWDSYAETTALLAAAAALLGRAPDSALDVACGAGRTLRDFARAGLIAYGLDRDARLLRYAKRRLGELGLSAELIVADMRDFTLPQPVDVAGNAINGIGYLTEPGDLDRHLAAVAANLVPGGVYIVEMSFGPVEAHWLGKGEPWAFERGTLRVMADWRLLSVDEETGLAEHEATLIVQRRGEPERRVVCRHRMRKWDQPSFYARVAAGPLRLAQILGRDLQPRDPEQRLTYDDDNVFVFLQK
ncbi:MAG TPA: class I SAM-dependent methyltransferase [bacterium]|nr:class I SAM-dependent methyltransferase [bacterium]